MVLNKRAELMVMIKKEYEIEKKKKTTTTTTNKRMRMRMIREWVGVTVFTNYILKKNSIKIVKVASCDWGNIASNFFYEMLR